MPFNPNQRMGGSGLRFGRPDRPEPPTDFSMASQPLHPASKNLRGVGATSTTDFGQLGDLYRRLLLQRLMGGGGNYLGAP